jgi:hypothetical protein
MPEELLLLEVRGGAAKWLGAEALKPPCEADVECPENPPCDPTCWAQAGSDIPTTTSATAASNFMPPSYACFWKMDNDSSDRHGSDAKRAKACSTGLV